MIAGELSFTVGHERELMQRQSFVPHALGQGHQVVKRIAFNIELTIGPVVQQVPQLKYISGEYLDMVRDVLTSQVSSERGLFRKSYLDDLFIDPIGHITPLRGSELWQVALLEMWLQSHDI